MKTFKLIKKLREHLDAIENTSSSDKHLTAYTLGSILMEIQKEHLDKKIKYLNNLIDISDPSFPNRMNYISKCTRLEQKRAKL